MVEQKPRFPIHDNTTVIESYANKFVGSFLDGAAVNLMFGALRMDPEKAGGGANEAQQPSIYVTHRLTLSPSAAFELMNNLNTVLSALDAQRKGAQQKADQAPRAP